MLREKTMRYLKSKVLAAFAAWVFAAISYAHAQTARQYPSKPIMFVIPFAAGGDADLSGRNIAQTASKYLNNATIVSANRVGASGAIGATAVKNAPPDGYTLLVARIGGIPAIRSPAETEKYVREQYELYDKLVTMLGIRQ